MTGLTRALGVVSLAALLLGCPGAARKTEAGSEAGEAKPAAPIPATEAEFLAELVPLDGGAQAIQVDYAITGPALTGTMTTSITTGGQRRDQWELVSTLGDTQLRAAGVTIVNAKQIWTANEGHPGELSDNHLAELARAYLRLEPDARAPVVESIRAWHALLAEQRKATAGDRAELLGVSCLQTRIAAQNVCMWEETGLLLRYEGSAFTIEATKINREPKLPANAFELPAEAAGAQRAEPAHTYDYDQILTEIAAGSYGNVSLLVVGSKSIPSLRLPDPAASSNPQDSPDH
ncbi:hypothetical protein DB30_02378 [Enhygromyxa salina]|uniref:Lipoprotein n=1 Tax=Enhygromyxa salina TaxID=215803 RepID=A0A0C1ZLY8_9BACT|nr:hypothetical protein [Enhygromyxa salina]KIG11858.1 hypothetical protein DB30_02378 [Enhygromyxa salina]